MKGLWRRSQTGIGLVEVLVALLVLAIGVLGYAGLQLVALKGAEEANNRAQATLIAQDALERFWGNEDEMAEYIKVDAWAEDYAAPGDELPGRTDCMATACTAVQIRERDIKQLTWMAANFLPAGRILATDCEHKADMDCVVVSWDEEQDPEDCLTEDGVNQDEGSTCVVMEVRR